MNDPNSQVLVAHVHSEDSVCIVRADEVGKALYALHGEPKDGAQLKVNIEYVLMPALLLAEMEDFDRSGHKYCD